MLWEISWNLIFTMIFMVMIAVLFIKQIQAREIANAAAKRLCQQQQVAFLDGTVSFQKIWPRFDKRSGNIKLQRYYAFDYLPSMIDDIISSRKTGFIVMIGDKVESIGFIPEVQN